MTYDNTNSGALFKNKDKTPEHPNWADYQGNINVGGKEFYISAWLKTAKSGQKYMSLSVEEKMSRKEYESRQADPATGGASQVESTPTNFDDFDDSSIPF